MAEGDHEGALVLYSDVGEFFAGTREASVALVGIARVYLEMDRPLSCTEVLSPAMGWLPEDLLHRAHFLLAEGYEQAGDCPRAIPLYERYRAEGTSLDDLVADRLAWCYRALGEHKRAAEEFTLAAGPYRTLSARAAALEEAARDLRQIGDFTEALVRYDQILSFAANPWYRATVLYWTGEAMQEAGRPDDALARWQEVLDIYPETAAASWAADALNNAAVPVDPYHVALAFRAAGRSAEAVAWFAAALEKGTTFPEARYALAMARAEAGDLEGALDDLGGLAQENPTDPRPLWEQGRLLENAGSVAQALAVYRLLAERFPDSAEAGEALWRAGRLLEGQGHYDEAAAEYEVLLERFPNHGRAVEALFRAGLIYYRRGHFSRAAALWTDRGGDGTPRIELWRGLALARSGQLEPARLAWEAASAGEGYYAARARELLSGGEGFGEYAGELIGGDEAKEQAQAKAWMVQAWGQPVSATLPAEVRADPTFARAEELLALGRPDEARQPFALLLERFDGDGPSLYSLAIYLRQRHFYALSIRAAERLLETLPSTGNEVPDFLLRLLYPIPYAHLIVAEAQANQIDPLTFFALVRQESRFDRYATSWAEARGLTQVIPSTGEGIAAALGFTPFRLADLYRPVVSVRFGAWYLGRQVNLFEGQTIPALAAYNGGPGNAQRWAGYAIPVADLDLFVEAIDFAETRDYIERIYTSYWFYRRLYAPPPTGKP